MSLSMLSVHASTSLICPQMPSKPETAGVYPGGHYPGVGTPQTSEALRPGAQTGAYQRPAAHAGTTGRAF